MHAESVMRAILAEVARHKKKLPRKRHRYNVEYRLVLSPQALHLVRETFAKELDLRNAPGGVTTILGFNVFSSPTVPMDVAMIVPESAIGMQRGYSKVE